MIGLCSDLCHRFDRRLREVEAHVEALNQIGHFHTKTELEALDDLANGDGAANSSEAEQGSSDDVMCYEGEPILKVIDRLEKENDALTDGIADCLAEIDELEQELAELRARLDHTADKAEGSAKPVTRKRRRGDKAAYARGRKEGFEKGWTEGRKLCGYLHPRPWVQGSVT
jgi:flagellar biosynthesis/type III secretory pathway protein FliH